MSSLSHFSLTHTAVDHKIVSRPKKHKASSGWVIKASKPLKKNLIAGPTIKAININADTIPITKDMLISLSLLTIYLLLTFNKMN